MTSTSTEQTVNTSDGEPLATLFDAAATAPPQILSTSAGDFRLKETVNYSNGGSSCYYVLTDTAIIIDDSICDVPDSGEIFDYSQITNKQNEYMAGYNKVYRFLGRESEAIEYCLVSLDNDNDTPERSNNIQNKKKATTADRADTANPSPLERQFEESFAQVYGSESLKYLNREYAITDLDGTTRFLDYLVKTRNGNIAVEENGIRYHHPQIVGEKRYRDQLLKQNSCTEAGVKLYRFSTEDCRFAARFEDDIRTFFGTSTDGFIESGFVADRPFKLYERQEDTLEEMAEQRACGIQSFLAVLPTAAGKSLIAEEDMLAYARETGHLTALVLIPNDAVKKDWLARADASLREYRDTITICTYLYMERHCGEYAPDFFDYIVVDEAHHAVAPGLKQTIQYFTPDFLVGLTATDERLDRQKLETVFGAYRVRLSLQEAMEKNIVARANVFRIETNIDLNHVRINGKEYVNADLEKSIRVTSRNELIAEVLAEYFSEGEAARRQGVVFCVNREHAREMQRALNAARLSAKAYIGGNGGKSNDAIMSAFRAGEIRFLCACQMISEGWDFPELGILVMARPTPSKVLYLQQLGRGLRRTPRKRNVFVVDVVDDYGNAVAPCTMHSIFGNSLYAPFGDILRRDHQPGDMIEIDGFHERIERITEVDVSSFADKYSEYLSVEQLAREYFVSTSTIASWTRKGKVQPTVSFEFGSRKIHLFSPEDAERMRIELGLREHGDETVRDDFFEFLKERDYSLSYKMPFLLIFLDNMDPIGDAPIEAVLDGYIAFYLARIDAGLPVDRRTCPYNSTTLADRKFVKRSMLANPFEKFERKRFLCYSKDLEIISMNHALHAKLTPEDYETIRTQMHADLEDYYAKL